MLGFLGWILSLIYFFSSSSNNFYFFIGVDFANFFDSVEGCVGFCVFVFKLLRLDFKVDCFVENEPSLTGLALVESEAAVLNNLII